MMKMLDENEIKKNQFPKNANTHRLQNIYEHRPLLVNHLTFNLSY